MTGETRYVIRYAMTADGAVDAARLSQASMYRLVGLSAFVTIPVGLAIGFVVDPSTGFSILAVGLVGLLMTRTRSLDRWAVRRRARSVLGGRIELQIDDAGITVHGPTGSGTIPWLALTAVREDDRTVLFVRDRLVAAYAPASAFGQSEQREEIIGYVRERIADAAARRSATQTRTGERQADGRGPGARPDGRPDAELGTKPLGGRPPED